MSDVPAELTERRRPCRSRRETGVSSRLGSRRGLTLIELLFVLVIFLFLTALIVPALGTTKGKSRCLACMSRARSIGSCIRTYASNWDGWANPDPCYYVKEFGYKLISETGYDGDAPPWYVPSTADPTKSQQRAESVTDFRCYLDESPIFRAHGIPTSYQVCAPFAGQNIMAMRMEPNRVLAVAEVGERHPYGDGDRFEGHYVYADLSCTLGYGRTD